ncbi:tetratricopeptide repeat protein [Haliea sp. E1-2-M8]|uniref:tetratricopeptide repeat protein n=1 Tax=Haliea sp. E1-2-M8 TaxID=3064706 RepID=UPI002717FB3F|nr:tetratricopeptide repeat protein [Haliea sp. E1-2-M8]MDO8862644.1 tetratricopeptide repeat protein [Haliea sp. E1-2-M8]
MAQVPWLRAAATLLCSVFLMACTTLDGPAVAASQLPPLVHEGTPVTLAEVAALAPSPDLLAVTPEMQAFVARYAPPRGGTRQRLLNLHEAVKGPGALGVVYDPFADGTAATVFRTGTANCLSFAHLFVALAREAGLDAQYQWLEVRPQWTRLGERIAVRLHVNVMVRMPSGEQFMVDIDPLQSRDIAASRLLEDADAAALDHNNIAIEALARGDLEAAWSQLARALQLSPGLPPLWVNLGAVYRHAGQVREAEWSLLQALAIDRSDRSAMNNLVVLYGQMGRDDERDYWVDRIDRHRDRNPFYHAWLGDRAGEEGDWAAALEHYRVALKLHPDDSVLLYATGIIHFRLQQYAAAERLIERAIAAASLRSDIHGYRAQLEVVRQRQLAETQPAAGSGATRI